VNGAIVIKPSSARCGCAAMRCANLGASGRRAAALLRFAATFTCSSTLLARVRPRTLVELVRELAESSE